MFLRAFATLIALFWRGQSGAGKGKDGAGFCGLPPLPQEQGHGKDGAPGGCDDFSEIFLHGCSLRTTTSIVRFWELIARKVGLVYFGALVVCFVGFRGGAENWGA